jgi:tetratricopeptide (TPR) repeat protein
MEGVLAFAISSAGLHQGQAAVWAINIAQKVTGLRTASTAWAAAWTLLLLGDWAGAEAFLDEAVLKRPGEPTLLTLLAICQSQRGKLQSAIVNARAACTPRPPNVEYEKTLVDLLLDGGYLNEARERLATMETAAQTDAELMFSMVRMKLMQRDIAAAGEWTALLKQNSIQPKMLVRLGGAYEVARNAEKAESCYQEALGAGHFPEALLGLARLEAHRRNKEQAEKHLLAALNVTRPLGEGATGPLPLFHEIIKQLCLLREPVLNCRAWFARQAHNTTPAASAGKSFLIYAPARQLAEQQLLQIIGAMQPGGPPMLPGRIQWREAPRQQQPDGPCRPGVQGVFDH